MITIGETKIAYDYMGVFSGEESWIHPRVKLDTYELIFVSEGIVYIEEEDDRYALSRGDYIILARDAHHGGYRESGCKTVFTWLHFYAEQFEALAIPKTGHAMDARRAEFRLRELGHLAQNGTEQACLECELLSLLFGFKYEAMPMGNKLCADVAEYIRVHIAEPPTAESVAQHFSYTADHLSRLFRRAYGVSLKEYIDNARLSFIREALLVKSASVKEIAASCGFEDGNRLSKFFKYHTGKTPGEYRASFFSLHTNII